MSDLGCLTFSINTLFSFIHNQITHLPVTSGKRNSTGSTVCDTDGCILCIVLVCITLKKKVTLAENIECVYIPTVHTWIHRTALFYFGENDVRESVLDLMSKGPKSIEVRQGLNLSRKSRSRNLHPSSQLL